MKLDHGSLEARLLGLPASDRARLAELLLDSLEGAAADVDAAWGDEAERRHAELVSGQVTGVPAAQVFAEADAELNRRGE